MHPKTETAHGSNLDGALTVNTARSPTTLCIMKPASACGTIHQ